jgi:peroxiredoxin
MQAPLTVVTLDSGETRDLADFYKEKPLILVFLRHFGCIFCREQIAELREFKSENIVLISMGRIQEASDFKRKMEIPQPLVSDPNKLLYEAFGLRRGSFGQILNPTLARKSIRLMKEGHKPGIVKHDPWMMAGVFRIEQDGEVSYSHFASDISDNLSGAAIAQLLKLK